MSNSIVNQLQFYLEKHKLKEANQLMESNDLLINLRQDDQLLWNIIPVIGNRLRTLNEFRFKTFAACEQMLINLAKVSKPKEVLIILMSELESHLVDGTEEEEKTTGSIGDRKCDFYFKAILKPLEYSIMELTARQNETLKFVLSALNKYISTIPVPSEYNLEPGKERMFLENDSTTKRIHSIMPQYLDFLSFFVHQIDQKNNGHPPKFQKNYTLQTLVYLCHHPFICLDLNHEDSVWCLEYNESVKKSQEESVSEIMVNRKKNLNNLIPNLRMKSTIKLNSAIKTKNESLLCATKIIELMSVLEPNMYNIFQIPSSFDEPGMKRDDENDLAMGVISFVVLGMAYSPTRSFVPLVYTHMFVFIKHLPLICSLLDKRQSLVVEKGLYLANHFVLQLTPSSLDSSFLEILKKHPLDKRLVTIMRFSSIKFHREKTLTILKLLINCFNKLGKYQILFALLSQPDQHPGVRGLVVGLYKDLVIQELNSTNSEEPIFTGTNLHRFLKKAVQRALPEHEETDLLENSDAILSVLNFIRYLLLFEGKKERHSGIWSLISTVDLMIQTLRRSVDLTKAHYKLELKRLLHDEKKKKVTSHEKFKLKILNDNNDDIINDDLPSEHEIEFIRFALSKLDLIESVFSRVNEILSDRNIM